MIVVGVVAFAACICHASKFTWGLQSGTLNTEKVDAGTAYLCYYTGSTANWATELAKLTAYDATTITGTMGMQLVKVADSADPTKTTGNNATFAYNGVSTTKKVNNTDFISPASFSDGSTSSGSFYYVVIDDGGKDIAYTTVAQTATINVGTGASTKLVTTSKFSYAAASVPEPTSAMLLLLGVAGLALRRHRA